jgi:RNA polymerase sigma-70 factor (ECF subfamily)
MNSISKSDWNDADLVRGTRSGDKEAYSELVVRYQGHVYGLAYSLVNHWADAQDIAQETFIRAYCNFDQLRDPTRFAAWLRRITFSVAMNWLKAFRPGLFEQFGSLEDLDGLGIPDFAPGPAEITEKRELAEAVLQAVATLPPKYRIPLTMFHLDGLSYQKVADFLDIPMGTTKSLIHRARKMLKPTLNTYVMEEVDSMIQEVFDEHKLPPEFIRDVWQYTVLRDAWQDDDEIKAVNSMVAEVEEFPEWSLQVRRAMPNLDGFEMCTHRWLEGLDDVMKMIGSEHFFPSDAGHCGDMPDEIVDAARQRVAAVQSWIEGKSASEGDLRRRVTEWLGEQNPEKTEAATCYVELASAYFHFSNDDKEALLAKWRARADQNHMLKLVFERNGFQELLEHLCGFRTIDLLDLYIRIIGGDCSQAAERYGGCALQLRFTLRDDPERFGITHGYLWGLQAYLLGRDEKWLQEMKSECAGAAIHALQLVSRAGAPTPLRRWLVTSMLKTTKLWCQHVINTSEGDVPAYAGDLPDVVAGIQETERHS